MAKERIKVLVQYEKNKENTLKALSIRPMTRIELCEFLKLTRTQVHNLLKYLEVEGHVEVADHEGYCPIINRSLKRYTTTDKEYIPKDVKLMKEQAARNKKIRENRVPRPPKNSIINIDKETKSVIKVNDHTTIYLNSKRPGSDYAWQRKKGSSGHNRGSMQSGMAMFANWE